MNDNVQLQVAFDYVCKTFFPRWDRGKHWKIQNVYSLPCEGQCEPESKTISLKSVHDNDDELHFIIIHEICHAWSTGHSKKWRNRMQKAEVKAKKIGRHKLSRMLKKEIELYASSTKIRASHVYNSIEDAVFDSLEPSYKKIIGWVAKEYGWYSEELEKYHKRCKEVYEKAIKEKRAMKTFKIDMTGK